jgi:hypothetical protein
VENYRTRLEDQGLSQADVDKFAAQKTLELKQYRALTIARSESAIAALNGQNEAWQQAADDGVIDREVAVRVWVTTPDDIADHHPPSCADFDGATAKLGEPFVVTSGGQAHTVMMPPLHPNCRCSCALRGEG